MRHSLLGDWKRRGNAALLAAVLSAVVLGGSATARHAEAQTGITGFGGLLTGNLTGNTPALSSPGDPQGSGSFSAWVLGSSAGASVCYTIRVKGINQATSTGIYREVTPGQVVKIFDLQSPVGADPSVALSCTTTTTSRASEILFAGHTSVRLVNNDFPNGALAANLVVTASSSAQFGIGAFAVGNTGANLSANSTALPSQGDPSGAGAVLVSIASLGNVSTICYGLRTVNINPATSAELIRRAPGLPDKTVFLFRPTNEENEYTVNRCTTTSGDLGRSILANPGNYVVIIRNNDVPTGALGGQLSKLP